jgi:SAM-dependent methyltransferase
MITTELENAPRDLDRIYEGAPRDLDRIYGERFSDKDARRKDAIWKEITRHLQRFVPADGAVLDLACDRGDFIRNIRARERWATDLRDVSPYLNDSIRFVRCNGLELACHVPGHHFDLVFMSNYLEHLPSSQAVIDQLSEVGKVLRHGGRAMILQPNIRLVRGHYWDFIDHTVALTEASLEEAAVIAGLSPVKRITRFLPYTTRSRLPQSAAMVRGYLAFPPAWRLLGKQTLLIAERPAGD